ncbi:MAG: hypothetical protein R3C16_12310 [Hyphomonadaceae bacterium]
MLLLLALPLGLVVERALIADCFGELIHALLHLFALLAVALALALG